MITSKMVLDLIGEMKASYDEEASMFFIHGKTMHRLKCIYGKAMRRRSKIVQQRKIKRRQIRAKMRRHRRGLA